MAFPVCWLGFSSHDGNRNRATYDGDSPNDYVQLDLGLLRVGPMVSYAFTDQLAMDAFINAAPTLAVGYDNGRAEGYSAVGVLVVPGARMRYRRLTFGAEIQAGTTRGTSDSDGETDVHISIVRPRLSFGVKF